MKRLIIILFAFLAYTQTAQAATSALANSVREYVAITDYIGAPNFSTISSDEYIIDIERITRRVDILGRVKYRICTKRVAEGPVVEGGGDEGREHISEYIATLLVAPNPGVGPRIVTVISFEPANEHNSDG